MKTFIFESKVTSKIFRVTAKSIAKAFDVLYFEHGICTNQMTLIRAES